MKNFLSLLALCLPLAAAVTLEWDPNPEPDVNGYIVYVGNAPRNYTNAIPVTATTVTLQLDTGKYYFAVTAHDTNGLESAFSDEVSCTIATKPTRLRISPSTNQLIRVSLQQSTDLTNWITVAGELIPGTNSVAFFRTETQ